MKKQIIRTVIPRPCSNHSPCSILENSWPKNSWFHKNSWLPKDAIIGNKKGSFAVTIFACMGGKLVTHTGSSVYLTEYKKFFGRCVSHKPYRERWRLNPNGAYGLAVIDGRLSIQRDRRRVKLHPHLDNIIDNYCALPHTWIGERFSRKVLPLKSPSQTKKA